MGVVLQEALTWYNLPLTVLLGIVLFYWIMVIVGVLSAESFDFDLDADTDIDIGGDLDLDTDVDVDGDIGMEAEAHVDAGMHHDADLVHGTGGLGLTVLRFLNFGKVPAMVVISALVVSLWFFSMVANFALNQSGFLLVSMAIFAVNFLVSLVVTKIATAPLVPLFRMLNQDFDTHEPIVGRECIIRSVTANEEGGRADVEREGAPFQIRVYLAPGREPLKKGDRALVADYDEEKDTYLIKQLN